MPLPVISIKAQHKAPSMLPSIQALYVPSSHLHVNNGTQELLDNRLNKGLERSSLVHEAHGKLSRGEADLAVEPALEHIGVEVPANT